MYERDIFMVIIYDLTLWDEMYKLLKIKTKPPKIFFVIYDNKTKKELKQFKKYCKDHNIKCTPIKLRYKTWDDNLFYMALIIGKIIKKFDENTSIEIYSCDPLRSLEYMWNSLGKNIRFPYLI